MFSINSRIVSENELKSIIQEAKSKNKKIIWTNGCFDILHIGHVRYLDAARALGDLLVVGVNSDSSTRQLKGENRPVLPQAERAAVVAALRSVDFVVIFDELSPKKLLKNLEPDIFAKGGDYTPATINGAEREIVESYGGIVKILPKIDAVSTSSIITRLHNIKKQ